MKRRVVHLGLASAAATALVAGLMPVGLSTTAEAAVQPFALDQTWDPNAGISIMNPNSVTNAIFPFVELPLATQTQSHANGKFYPEVASHWNYDRKTVTVFIRGNEGWSDGTPVTARDVVMSIQLGYLLGNDWATYLKSIKVVNDHEVQITQNRPYNAFEMDILNAPIYPYSEYGKLVPANIASIYETSLGKGKSAAKASTEIANLAQKISGYKSNFFVGNGPYEYDGQTSGEVSLKVNPYFWNAKNIHVPQVIIYNAQGNAQAWGHYMGGKVDFGQYIVTPQILKQWLNVKGHEYNAPMGYSTSNLVFNPDAYPFNMIKVRQAIAYLVDRKQITKVAEPVMGAWIQKPTGFAYLTPNDYLTKKQTNSLNSYSYNPAKAASLLNSAGFHKTSSGWIMPNGKPFTSAVYAYAGASDWQIAVQQIAQSLTNFGIQTTARTVEQNTYWNAYDTGKGYPMFLQYGGGAPVPSWQMSLLLSWFGYYRTAKGTTAHTSNMITMGSQTVKLPNGQVVNIPAAAWALGSASSTQEKALVWKLAQALNYDMITDPIWAGINGSLYSTQHYVGWPQNSSPTWNLWGIGSNPYQDLPWFFISEGWLKPAGQ